MLQIDTLGVPQLKRLWSRSRRTAQGQPTEPSNAQDWTFNKIVLDGLGLAVEETSQYLQREQPTYEAFEQWVLEKNDGQIDPRRVARINAAIDGTPYDERVNRWLREIEQSEPVLSAQDFAFWEENGYVILHEAVSAENCRAAEQAMWEFLGMDRSDPESWYRGQRDHGIMVQIFHHPSLKANRNSPRIHKAFAQIWGTPDLWVTIDRMSMNPPERAGYRFPGPRLHWDTSLAPPIPLGVQGVLYLTDTAANQGAFTCVPGFHRRIEDWLKSLPPNANPRTEDLEKLGATPIAGRAGDLIIWHHALPHGSSPNRATRPRIVQYVKMYPTRIEPSRKWK